MAEAAARTGTAPRVTIETRATRESLRLLSGIVQVYLREVAGLPDDDARAVRIRLAIVEATTNVIRHGYAGREPGPVALSLECDGARLTCILTDRADRFDPFAREPSGGASLPRPESLATGGYGRGIIGAVMDTVRHRYDPAAGNELTMTVRLRAA
jgi:serine/threonine-protein kinase RsbW